MADLVPGARGAGGGPALPVAGREHGGDVCRGSAYRSHAGGASGDLPGPGLAGRGDDDLLSARGTRRPRADRPRPSQASSHPRGPIRAGASGANQGWPVDTGANRHEATGRGREIAGARRRSEGPGPAAPSAERWSFDRLRRREEREDEPPWLDAIRGRCAQRSAAPDLTDEIAALIRRHSEGTLTDGPAKAEAWLCRSIRRFAEGISEAPTSTRSGRDRRGAIVVSAGEPRIHAACYRPASGRRSTIGRPNVVAIEIEVGMAR